MVNRKKQALVAAGQSRRRIPTTEAIETWLDQVMEEDPSWGWVFAMVATYGLRPHEVWHIGSLPDAHGLITVGEAAHHIKVTKTGFRAAVPLPAAWVERYGLGGSNREQRLAELRNRHRPKYVNEEGQPFDATRDAVKRCDNNERLGAICCHKLRSCDARAEFELRHKLYAWVETAPAQGGRKAQKRKERCVPYDLRHAYEIRARECTTWRYADVAAVMGHSPEVHRHTYLREISGEQTMGGGGAAAAGGGVGGLSRRENEWANTSGLSPLDLPQQLTSQLKGMERLVGGQNGSILFRHPELRGIPDLVVEGDGYTMEFIGSTLLCLDIQDPSGMVRLLAEPLKDQLPVGV